MCTLFTVFFNPRGIRVVLEILMDKPGLALHIGLKCKDLRELTPSPERTKLMDSHSPTSKLCIVREPA